MLLSILLSCRCTSALDIQFNPHATTSATIHRLHSITILTLSRSIITKTLGKRSSLPITVLATALAGPRQFISDYSALTNNYLILDTGTFIIMLLFHRLTA